MSKKSDNYTSLSTPLVAPKRNNGAYLFEQTIMGNKAVQGEDIVIPLVVDTEFWQPTWADYLKDSEHIQVKHKGKEKILTLPNFWEHGRYGVTTQIKGIHEKKGLIFAHPDLVEIADQLGEKIRHPLATSGFHPIDYLNQLGIKTTLHHSGHVVKEFRGERIPTCEFVLYGHYLLAEWGMIASGEYKKDLTEIALSNKNRRLEMQRRLRTVTEGKYGQSDSVDVPWRIRINGLMYRVKITLIDTCAIHGIASYKDFCESAGIKLEAKSKMDNYKSVMHIAYFDLPEDFDEYALGDLEVYNALFRNAEQFKLIWKSLNVEEYYQPPKLTIGATVRDIFAAKVYKLFKISPDNTEGQKELLDKVCKYGTAEYLKQFITSTECLNAKVAGGRCGNNRPNLVYLSGVLVDIDYSGCYGEGQRNQLYPFGRPLIDEYDYPSSLNKYLSLREWLKARKWGRKDCELIPGLWQARVFTREDWKDNKPVYSKLNIAQDFLASWFDFKLPDISKMKTDSELVDLSEEESLEVKTGLTKIFNNQVINAVITHDFVDWLFNVCSPVQKNELLDNLYIHTAMYYPAYDRVNSPEELLEKITNHQGKNKTKTNKRKGGSRKTKTTEECTAWYAVNLGEFIIDDLLAWRKIYPKKNPDGSKNPMNNLYKLCTNTLYGDMTSPYFEISNTVVGNNITARARAACWYAEKGFYGCQSITDGTAFDVNGVVYPASENRRVTAQSVVNLHREKDPKQRNLRVAPLDNCEKIELLWKTATIEDDKGTVKTFHLPTLILHKNGKKQLLKPTQNDNGEWVTPAMDWINKAGMSHLQSLFNVDVLQAETTKLKVRKENNQPVKEYIPRKGQFEFEAKAFYDRGFFHGSANYYLQGEGGSNLAMRSYEKDTEHDAVLLGEEEEEIFLTKYFNNETPAKFFMKQLQNPTRVKRSRVFIKQGILKLNDAKKNSSRWLDVGRVAGDSIQKSGLLREFSLSQFTFQTIEQFKAIEKEMAANKRRFCQSYEGYFINDDKTLNFKLMIESIDKAISESCESFNKLFDKSRHRHRNEDMKHPEQEVLDRVRLSLLRPNNERFEDFFDLKSAILVDEEGITYIPDDDEYQKGELLDDLSLLDELIL